MIQAPLAVAGVFMAGAQVEVFPQAPLLQELLVETVVFTAAEAEVGQPH